MYDINIDSQETVGWGIGIARPDLLSSRLRSDRGTIEQTGSNGTRVPAETPFDITGQHAAYAYNLCKSQHNYNHTGVIYGVGTMRYAVMDISKTIVARGDASGGTGQL